MARELLVRRLDSGESPMDRDEEAAASGADAGEHQVGRREEDHGGTDDEAAAALAPGHATGGEEVKRDGGTTEGT